MSWLAKIDATSRRWPAPLRWLYVALKWYLVAVAAFAWVAIWWERHPLLGLAQAGIIGWLLLRELRPHLRGHRRDDPLHRPGDTPRAL